MVAGNHRVPGRRNAPFHDIEVSPTHGADGNSYEQIAGTGLRDRDFRELERLIPLAHRRWPLEKHRAHVVQYVRSKSPGGKDAFEHLRQKRLGGGEWLWYYSPGILRGNVAVDNVDGDRPYESSRKERTAVSKPTDCD